MVGFSKRAQYAGLGVLRGQCGLAFEFLFQSGFHIEEASPYT